MEKTSTSTTIENCLGSERFKEPSELSLNHCESSSEFCIGMLWNIEEKINSLRGIQIIGGADFPASKLTHEYPIR